MSEQNQETVVPDSDATIQVKGVTKRFGVRVAVDNLSFDVNRGEIVGFLGPNGSGKTTTMRMLTSYYTPDIGSIAINGMDTQEDDIVTREAIGYLPENNPLYEDMLVSEYLAFVAELRGLSGAERRRNLDLTVEETGIQEVFYRPSTNCRRATTSASDSPRPSFTGRLSWFWTNRPRDSTLTSALPFAISYVT